MGMSYEQLLKAAEILKERLWYFINIHEGAITETEIAVVKDKMNDLLDSLDELPFKNLKSGKTE